MRRNLLVLVVVALVVSAMIMFGAHRARYRASTAAEGGSLGPGENVGKLAPDFELVALNGSNVKLSSYRGKGVLVNFWATWCGPCKLEMPWLVELQNKYQQQGFEVVGISMDDGGKDAVEKFTKEMGVNYTIVLGKDTVADAYGGIMGLPTTFFIDRNGRIVEQASGLIGKGDIEDSIKKTLRVPSISEGAHEPYATLARRTQ